MDKKVRGFFVFELLKKKPENAKTENPRIFFIYLSSLYINNYLSITNTKLKTSRGGLLRHFLGKKRCPSYSTLKTEGLAHGKSHFLRQLGCENAKRIFWEKGSDSNTFFVTKRGFKWIFS